MTAAYHLSLFNPQPSAVVLAGLITKDTVIYAGQTCYMKSNVVVPKGKTLEIKPGAILLFSYGVSLEIVGGLVANGTAEKPIIMKGLNGAQWGGLIATKVKEVNLNYVHIMHAAKIISRR